MAGSEVYVSFGGDTAGLEASLASANASVRAFARELAALSAEQVKAGASAESEIGRKMLAVATELSEAKERIHELKGEASEGGGEAEGGFLSRMKEGLEGVLAPIGEASGPRADHATRARTARAASPPARSFGAKLMTG